MNQHIVPRFYLYYGFSDSGFVYSTDINYPSKGGYRNVRSCFYGKDYYSSYSFLENEMYSKDELEWSIFYKNLLRGLKEKDEYSVAINIGNLYDFYFIQFYRNNEIVYKNYSKEYMNLPQDLRFKISYLSYVQSIQTLNYIFNKYIITDINIIKGSNFWVSDSPISFFYFER